MPLRQKAPITLPRMSSDRSPITFYRISFAALVAVSLLGALGAAFCVVRSEDNVTLVGPLPAYNGAYLLRVQQEAGPWTFHGHALVFGPTIYIHDVWLPYPPKAGRTTYSWREVTIQPIGKSQAFPLTAGTVTVDRDAESVNVQIDIAYKPFMSNGNYRLRIDRSSPAAERGR
jgi:hypothetical protein